MESVVNRHHPITNGFELVRLPGVRQQQLFPMPIACSGRDVKPCTSPEIRHRPAAAAAPLAKSPQHAATEQHIPFRDRWHVRRFVRRSFSQPGTDEQKQAKAVSAKASARKAFGPRK